MRLSGSVLFCLCYVRLVRPVFILRCECCVTVPLFCLCYVRLVRPVFILRCECCVTVPAVLFMLCPSGSACVHPPLWVLCHSTHSGRGTQAEPDGHNINKTARYQITSCTVCLSNFIPTVIYAPWGWSHRGIETCRRYFKSILIR